MKNAACQLFAFTMVVALSGVFAQQVNAQVEVSKSEKKWVDLGAKVAKKVPVVGQFLSPIVGLLFEEEDPIPALRAELMAYCDTKVLELDKRLKDDILNEYNNHLITLEEFRGDPNEFFEQLRVTEHAIDGHYESFKSKGPQKATRNLIFMSAQAQLHLRILDRIIEQKPDDPFWKKHDVRIWERYKDYATSQVDKVVGERRAQIVPTKIYTGGANKGLGRAYHWGLLDTKTGHKWDGGGSYAKKIDEELRDVRLFWKKHLLDPINYERESAAVQDLFEGNIRTKNSVLLWKRNDAVRTLDVDKDGKVQMTEMPINRGVISTSRLATLKKFDRNNDDKWDRGELNAFFLGTTK